MENFTHLDKFSVVELVAYTLTAMLESFVGFLKLHEINITALCTFHWYISSQVHYIVYCGDIFIKIISLLIHSKDVLSSELFHFRC